MESVVHPAGAFPSGIGIDILFSPAFRRLSTVFATESVDPWASWLLAAEGLAAWVRHIDQALADHLDDRHRARVILTTAYAEMLQRRMSTLATPITERLTGKTTIELRAFFEALSPGPIARSIRWNLDGITQESPTLAISVEAWRHVHATDAKSRLLEISQHFDELTIVLAEYLSQQNVPRAAGWLGDVYHAFGKEIADVFGQSGLPTQTITPTTIETDVAPAKHDSDKPRSPWQPPTTLKGHGSHAARMANIAEEKDPVAGIMGPASLYWECSRESIMLLGGGRAALMQLAHPSVAHAIRDHSVVHTDMLGRFIRTMKSAYGVVFGSMAEMQAISERVYKVHSAISGKLDDIPGHKTGHYYALDPEAVFWVGATLVDTVIFMYEQMVRPLEEAEKDRLVREAGPFWVAFGVPLETCPNTWTDLHGYVLRQTEALAPLVGNSARQQASLLFAPHPSHMQPIFDQLRIITAHTLPNSLRGAFHMDLNPRERMLARSWLFAAERVRPWLPSPLRFVPPYHQAKWRLWRAGR